MNTCDEGNESLTKILVSVQTDVLNHFLLVQEKMGKQRVLLDRMTVLAQRYTIIANELSPKRTNYLNLSHQVEDDIKAEFYVKLQNVHHSNSELTESVANVAAVCNSLSRFVNGAQDGSITSWQQDVATQQPISFYLELFADCLKFFTRSQCYLNCLAKMFRPGDVSTMERYKKQLEPNNEFNEFFLKSFVHCKRLHTNKKPNA